MVIMKTIIKQLLLSRAISQIIANQQQRHQRRQQQSLIKRL